MTRADIMRAAWRLYRARVAFANEHDAPDVLISFGECQRRAWKQARRGVAPLSRPRRARVELRIAA